MTSPAQHSNRIIVAGVASVFLISALTILTPLRRPVTSAEPSISSSPSTEATTRTSVTSTTEVRAEDDDLWMKFEPATPIVSIFPDTRLPAVSTPSDLDESVPSRPAALLQNPFESGIDEDWFVGLTEPKHFKSDHDLGDRPFSCDSISQEKYEFGADEDPFLACGHARTLSGDFLLVARSAGLNHYDWKHVAAIAIDVLALRTTSAGRRVAAVVLKGHISRDRCSPSSYVETGKARVGDDEVFVVNVDGQLSVLAMSDEGVPNVVASYANFSQRFSLSATDRSLVLGSKRSTRLFTVRELFPSGEGWRERIHLTKKLADPRYKYVENDPQWVHFDRRLTKPTTLVSYEFPGYTEATKSVACDPTYRRALYAD